MLIKRVNMKFINLRIITFFALTSLLFSSCDKIELPKPLGDRGQTVVKFITAPNDNGTNYNLVTINLSTTPQSLGVVDIRRDVPNETELNKTMTVTVKEDPAVISAFNNANGSDLVALPSANYTVDPANPRTGSDYTVTFQPGEFAKWLKITIPNSAALDLSKRYAIGLTIVVAVTGADGRVSFENRSTVVEIGLKNKWDGIYKLSGYTLRDGDAVKTGNFAPIEMALITTSPTSVSYGDLQIWADGTGVGIGIPQLSISEATTPNPVTVTSSGGATNIPGPSNIYNPATKTFSLDFTWGAGIASRRATVTLEYLRPR
jgi:hypothetical protein